MLEKVFSFYRSLRQRIEKDLFSASGSYNWLGAPLPDVDPDRYFLDRQNERIGFINTLLQSLPMRDLSVCSIATGFGPEEYLLKDKVRRLVLIEPSAVCYDFLLKKFGTAAEISPKPMQNFKSGQPFDVILTSGPSNWVHQHPAHGMPSDFLRFIDSYLKKDGIFFARIYGGLHTIDLVASDVFLRNILRTISPRYELAAAFFDRPRHQSLLVIVPHENRQNRQLETLINELEKFEGVPTVRNGQILRLPRSRNVATKSLLVLKFILFLVPLRIAADLTKALSSIVRDLKVNLSLK